MKMNKNYELKNHNKKEKKQQNYDFVIGQWTYYHQMVHLRYIRLTFYGDFNSLLFSLNEMINEMNYFVIFKKILKESE